MKNIGTLDKNYIEFQQNLIILFFFFMTDRETCCVENRSRVKDKKNEACGHH